MQSFAAETSTFSAESAERRGGEIATGTSVSGESYSPTLQTAGTRSTGASIEQEPVRRRAHVPRVVVAPRIRHRIDALLTACIESLERASDNETEFFARNNAVEDFKKLLDDLWQLRGKREGAYAESINILQTSLLDRDAESLSVRQLDALRSVVIRLRDDPVIADDVPREVARQLLQGGIDVFRALE